MARSSANITLFHTKTRYAHTNANTHTRTTRYWWPFWSLNKNPLSGTTLSVSRPFSRRLLVFVCARACVYILTYDISYYIYIYIPSISPYIFEIIYFKELSAAISFLFPVIWDRIFLQTVQNIYHHPYDYYYYYYYS